MRFTEYTRLTEGDFKNSGSVRKNCLQCKEETITRKTGSRGNNKKRIKTFIRTLKSKIQKDPTKFMRKMMRKLMLKYITRL